MIQYLLMASVKLLASPIATLRYSELLARYRYLSLHYLHAFVGGHLTALRDRVDLLACQPNLYLDIPVQQARCAHANYRPLIYELAPHGAAELAKRGFVSKRAPATPFPHEVMTCQIAASIELALRVDPALHYMPFELQPIAVRLNGKKHTIVSDHHPFVLGRDGNRKFYFGFEADTGSESRSTVIRDKFEKYLRIIEDKLHREVFGANTFYIPFITASEAIERHTLEVIRKLTNGKGSEHILVKNIPLFYSAMRPAPPDDHIVREPWRRAGFPDFYMAK